MIHDLRTALSGRKTHIVAAIAVLLGLLEGAFGIDIPGVDIGDDWVGYILGGLGFSTLRLGVAKSAPPGGGTPLGLALLALVLAAILGPTAAHATACAPREQAVEYLADTYGETRRGIGMSSDGTLMEVFAAEDSGTWTIAVTRPDGTMCMVASGTSYEVLAEALPVGAPT